MRFSLLSEMSETWARETPDKTAIVFGEARWSYAELHARVLRTVAALRASGIGPGDRVGHLGLNHADYVVLMNACFRVGAVLVAINWRLVAAEIAFVLRDAGVRLLVADSEFAGSIADARGEAAIGRLVLTDAADETPAFGDWIAGFAADAECHAASVDDVALQLYTSGTTGFPKGALLTHRSLAGTVAKGGLTGESWSEWKPDDVCLVAMPLYHIGGSGWSLHALAAGATAVILPRPDIAAIIDAVETHRVTKMFAVPAVLNMILSHPRGEGADLGSVKALLYGASPIPLDVLKRSMAKFPNASFIQCYGATETSGTVVYLPPADHDVNGTPRMAGCGKPFPGNEIRIVDEALNPLPPRAVGEIAIRSVSTMLGYHNNPAATAKAIRDGWYLSGDAGWMDEDGYLYIHDRVKDMIVSGAENIYPAEVENALHGHPAVADCAVIGVPDAKWGEAVKAIVVLRGEATAEELIAHARTRIAAYKVPKSVDFVAELPRNPSGKILKKELRKAWWPEGGRMVG
ncbi:long-chain-fatty-acid--CoA ligase [Sandaracinobacteroides saxicola]|uniref:3-methylmercaptopropionyl-CoA ligase n=1 Tax=Sandaracinobacteroides saxicola TaxID=2759707 RepID=A0A7G5IH40_9SPHN|nr:long-chain-fatty-acid--CoA ligase [Sandaracinobacteroides saxicola]QMW22682.1 long-chain-fatty-acid--CoA ligase [Sandaracinobacteroides saxicola]